MLSQIIVLSETGETARFVAKFHPAVPVVAVMVDGRIGRQIEGYMASCTSIVTNQKRGDGAHVRLAFSECKRKGLLVDGDPVICVNTQRNSESLKQVSALQCELHRSLCRALSVSSLASRPHLSSWCASSS